MDNESQDVQRVMHPSHEQLMLLYASLDKLETDVDSMNEMVEIYFPQPQYGENGTGYRNGMSREFDIWSLIDKFMCEKYFDLVLN